MNTKYLFKSLWDCLKEIFCLLVLFIGALAPNQWEDEEQDPAQLHGRQAKKQNARNIRNGLQTRHLKVGRIPLFCFLPIGSLRFNLPKNLLVVKASDGLNSSYWGSRRQTDVCGVVTENFENISRVSRRPQEYVCQVSGTFVKNILVFHYYFCCL